MLLHYIKRKIKPFLMPLLEYYRKAVFQVKWMDRNLHNETVAGNIFPFEKVSVGKGTYGTIHALHFGNKMERLSIGNYCSIAGEVVFLLGGNHKYKRLSTFPFYSKVFSGGPNAPTETNGPITIGDDVWIGCRSIILSGVTVGQGAIIAAGSVVSRNIPSYGIYINGKIVKYRFTENVISKLVRFSLDMDDEQLELLSKCYDVEINDDNVDSILEFIDKKRSK